MHKVTLSQFQQSTLVRIRSRAVESTSNVRRLAWCKCANSTGGNTSPQQMNQTKIDIQRASVYCTSSKKWWVTITTHGTLSCRITNGKFTNWFTFCVISSFKWYNHHHHHLHFLSFPFLSHLNLQRKTSHRNTGEEVKVTGYSIPAIQSRTICECAILWTFKTWSRPIPVPPPQMKWTLHMLRQNSPTHSRTHQCHHHQWHLQ